MVFILHFPKIWGFFFKDILMILVSFDAGVFLLLRLVCLKPTV